MIHALFIPLVWLFLAWMVMTFFALILVTVYEVWPIIAVIVFIVFANNYRKGWQK